MAGRDVFSDIIRPDRKLAVTAVDQDGQLDALRSSVMEYSFYCSADSPSGIDHIIHKDHCFAGYVAGNDAGTFRGHIGETSQVITVQRDINAADRNIRSFEAGNVSAKHFRERHATPLDAQKDQVKCEAPGQTPAVKTEPSSFLQKYPFAIPSS